MSDQKEVLMKRLCEHVEYIRGRIQEEKSKVESRTQKDSEILKLRSGDQLVQFNIRQQRRERIDELNELNRSFYFARCELTIDDGAPFICYFAKFHFIEEGISSWVSPIASIRFEPPGNVSYTLPSGEMIKASMLSVEHYTIVDGRVLYFSRETIETPKQLIYQEKITKRKSSFSLVEIVEKMEKRQDAIIRANYKCSTLISGPAGSGKTTLAFHRVAYLALAPNTAPMFPGNSIVIFIQDVGTKKYFSSLLPELGIRNVLITTFSSWAFNILKIREYKYIDRFGKNEKEKDLFEYEKLSVLRLGEYGVYKKNPFLLLTEIYKKNLSKKMYGLFLEQKRTRFLDRFDLTILLGSYLNKCSINDRERILKVLYSLIVVDEFQNYLPEQLKILKSFLSVKTSAMVYIGDYSQQVRIGTIRSWNEIQEVIPEEANFILGKTYRNTGSILNYIKDLGFSMDIPDYVEIGESVEEFFGSEDEQIQRLEGVIKNLGEQTLGVLYTDEKLLNVLLQKFGEDGRIHILSFVQSQGLEFDVVCIIGVNRSMFDCAHICENEERVKELKKIKKDGLYIALTRAISKLYVFGKEGFPELS